MKKLYPLFVLLFLTSNGLGQKLHEVIETYESEYNKVSGNIKTITYHKKIGDRVERVKFEGYYRNGQKRDEINYKNGRLNGLETHWYQNGQKKFEGTWKDGKEDGLRTRWYENGQKFSEETYKDGKYISYKEWNKDGSVNK